MSTTDRPRDAGPEGVAAACRDADLVHLVVRADGDAVAAAGTIAAACADAGTPYQVSVARTREEFEARRRAMEATATTVLVGARGDAPGIAESPLSLGAHEAATALGGAPDPVTALAGLVAGDAAIDDEAGALVERAGLERRPGVAVPTADLRDGLAHTTLVHADFSGDLEAAAAALSGLDLPEPIDVDGHRRAASLLALAAAGAPEASDRAGVAVEAALRPYALDGPFETLGGYADVLRALARDAPGLGVALAMGRDAREPALDVWRERARETHRGVREASTARYDGLVVARTESGAVEGVARLLCDYRSPEPAVLAVGSGEAGLATTEEPADAIERLADGVGGSGFAGGRTGYTRFESEKTEDFVDAVIEVIPR